MSHFPLPMTAFQKGDKQSSPDPAGLDYLYCGRCPIQLRCRDIKPPRSDARAVLVVLKVDEASWASRIADVIDAWETARQSDDPFWVAASSADQTARPDQQWADDGHARVA